MSAERKTIYLPAAVAKVLSDAESLSGRIASIVLLYDRIRREHLPSLTRQEWLALLDANNGCCDELMDSQAPGVMMWANIADSPGLGEKWSIDQDELVAKVRGWSYAEQIAAFEVCRKFWLNADHETEDALRLAGVVGV